MLGDGTQVQELIAGIAASVDYIAELGQHCDSTATNRRERCEWRTTRRINTKPDC